MKQRKAVLCIGDIFIYSRLEIRICTGKACKPDSPVPRAFKNVGAGLTRWKAETIIKLSEWSNYLSCTQLIWWDLSFKLALLQDFALFRRAFSVHARQSELKLARTSVSSIMNTSWRGRPCEHMSLMGLRQ